MKRILVCMTSVLVAAVLIMAGRSMISQAAVNATPVCGTLSSDTNWTLANSPYEVCLGGVTVAQGATLTIEPGVTVQFLSNARLTTSGALLGLGTPTQPITFTGVTTTPGSWMGILGFSGVITSPAQVVLDYVTLEYGGLSGTYGAQVAADNADITLTHSLIRNGGGSGIYHEGDADLVVHDTHFENNANDAIRIVSVVHDLSLSGLTASGNGRDVVHVTSTSYTTGQRRFYDPGLPYVFDSVVGNLSGDSIIIDPGNELIFSSTGYLNIGGEFKAIGLPGAPITITSETKTPGSWFGLVLYGGSYQASGQLEYVTIEYGGRNLNSANIGVTNGYLQARNSTIRYSQRDGVRFNSSGYGAVINSQIVDNTEYGVRNIHPAVAVLATNNWWGDPSGPDPDTEACGTGLGDRVSDGVLFRPVLTDTNITAPFPLSDAPILTLTPRRWFAPADGVTKVYFDITLKDGDGKPLAGRTVRLAVSGGTVTDGGITDLRGHTLAYLVNSTPGDVNVTASLDTTSPCGESALSPTTRVTFTTPVDITELFPNAPASYFDGNISITPLPVVVGITSTIQVKLTNPLTLPITVDVTFGFAQSGIGLAFGPIKEIIGQVIPPDSSVSLSAPFMPLLSGHYCVQASYTITAIGTNRVRVNQRGGSGMQQFNLNSKPSPMNSPKDKDILNKADNSWNIVSELAPDGTDIHMEILNSWWSWAKDTASSISQNLGFDPPRQDYDQITMPEWHAWREIQPDANTSAARAAAINAASAALADVNAYGTAAALALDRYAGASEAHDLAWAAQQAGARLYYEELMGSALLTYADSLDAFVQVLIDEGETNIHITSDEVITYQQRLATQGFTEQEIADARLLGLTDADIEAHRQEIINADPDDLAGNLLDFYSDEADISRELGYNLLEAYSFSPGSGVGGGGGLLAADAVNNSLAQIYNTVTTVQVSNPLTQSAVIDLETRRIDLPADWIVSVTPAQISLAPGEATTVTVSVLTGSLVPQGALPHVAVEGYVGNELLGGVVIEIVVPQYVLFDGTMHVYLPLLRKD